MSHFAYVLNEYFVPVFVVALVVVFAITYRRLWDRVTKSREEALSLQRQQTALLERIAAAVEKRDLLATSVPKTEAKNPLS